MRYLIVLLFTCLSVVPSSAQSDESTTVILVRHAEKAFDEKGDPGLTEEGLARAEELARVLGDINISAIYSTKFKRTRATVAPISKAKSLTIKEYNPFKLEEITDLIKSEKGKTLLFSGHSNTVPMMLNLLSGTNDHKHINESVYDNLFIVTIDQLGGASILPLKYGEKSVPKTE